MTTDGLQRNLPPAGDRLMTTLFIAALLHAIIILGVTFSASHEAAGGDEHGLEVLLVDGMGPDQANPDGRYAAQRSQRGSGTENTDGQTRVPRARQQAAAQPGSADDGAAGARGSTGAEGGAPPALASGAHSTRIVYFGGDAADASPDPQEAGPNVPTLGINPNEDGVELRIRGPARRQLWVAADTRASDVAAYLDRWRRRVERIGTLNFPSVALRQRNSGTPVIAVTIDAQGRLVEAQVRHSSGHRELDDAALRILRLAAPFDAFPAGIAATHDEVRIAYEWQFLDGVLAGSAVIAPDAGQPGAAP